jgi:hypothetical protein
VTREGGGEELFRGKGTTGPDVHLYRRCRVSRLEEKESRATVQDPDAVVGTRGD